jgi:hypothetical protein
VLLHDYGYKISKISTLSEDKIIKLTREIVSEKSAKTHAISSFKLAMMNFDQGMFFDTYNELLATKTFKEVFYEVVIPLMNEIGFLWQTFTITAAHEHFLSNLIKQKLMTNIEKLNNNKPEKTDKVFVLYLPYDEVHELGLMYLNYEVISNGYKSIYLGESVPLESLKDLKNYFDNIVYVCYMTVEPQKEEVENYIQRIENEVIDETSELWLIGRMTEYAQKERPYMRVFNSIESLSENL